MNKTFVIVSPLVILALASLACAAILGPASSNSSECAIRRDRGPHQHKSEHRRKQRRHGAHHRRRGKPLGHRGGWDGVHADTASRGVSRAISRSR